MPTELDANQPDAIKLSAVDGDASKISVKVAREMGAEKKMADKPKELTLGAGERPTVKHNADKVVAKMVSKKKSTSD